MGSHFKQIKDNKLNPGGLKIAFEGSHMSYDQYDNMKKVFPNTLWENTSMILEDLASVKDSYELDCIRTAVEVTDKVYEEILPMLQPGYTEKEVANKMVSKYREYAEGEAYSPIVATGPNELCLMLHRLIENLKKVILLSSTQQLSMEVTMQT